MLHDYQRFRIFVGYIWAFGIILAANIKSSAQFTQQSSRLMLLVGNLAIISLNAEMLPLKKKSILKK
jgi:hypothetical protein